MDSQDSRNCEKLREAFEGREAIYIEKGVLRVRVQNICCNPGARRIDAQIEEVPTPGLEESVFHRTCAGSPLRWRIGSGLLTTFSNSTWAAGYGGWSLFFDPRIVTGFVSRAAAWNSELGAFDRYSDALRFLWEQSAYEQPERVFSDSSGGA